MFFIGKNKIYIIAVLLFNTAIISCDKSYNRQIICDDTNIIKNYIANDSSILSFKDTITLNITPDLNPLPIVSQIIENDSSVFYLTLDNQNIYKFDLISDTLIDTISLSHLPKLSNLSGFYYYKKNYLVFSYKEGHIFILNGEGKIINDFSIGPTPIDIWGICGTSILFYDDRIFLSGPPASNTTNNLITTIAIDTHTQNKYFSEIRPNFYNHYNLGSDYLWRVYHSIDDEGNVIISLPISQEIYILDKDMQLTKRYYMPSRYFNILEEAPKNLTPYEEKAYYLSQHTYGPIYVDRSRHLIYRIATHPFAKNNHGGMTLKPFSIIVSTFDGEIISETPILNNDNTMFYDIIGSTSEGLYIQTYNKDENKMKFIIYDINYEKE